MKTLAASLSILTKQGVMLYLLRGVAFTCIISVLGVIMGLIVGSLLALARTYCKKGPSRILGWFATAYIELFRNTPYLLWIFICVVFCPCPDFFARKMFGLTSVEMKLLFKAALALILFNSSVIAEIVRGGIISIDRGQTEAARSIGMTHWQTMTTVVLPQAIRNILPSVGNELIVNIKDSSVLNVISVSELFFQAKSAAGTYYRYFEVYFIIAVIYLILTLSVSAILRAVEKKMDGPDNYVIHGSQSDSRADIKVSVKNEKEAVKRWNV